MLTFYVSFEFVHPTGLMLFRKTGEKAFQTLPDLGFNAADLVRATRAGDRLLVASSGLGRRPRIYDLKSGALLLRADDLMSASFCSGRILEL